MPALREVCPYNGRVHNLLALNLLPSLTERRLEDGSTFADAYARLTEEHAGIHERLLSYKEQWPLGWLDIPHSRPFLKQCRELAQSSRDLGAPLVCGIGGSALGPQAVLKALQIHKDLHWSLYLDNVDPLTMLDIVDRPEFEGVWIPISKSGTTLETMAAFIHLLGSHIQQGARDLEPDEIVAITDSGKGILREWAEREGWPTLPVPDDVGGRFSVFTPVGLFPLAFAGVDIDALLDGAAAWQTSAVKGELLHNEAWQLAALHYLLHTRGGAQMAVHYIYGDPLVLLGDWFRQLWAESLAKRQKLDGTTGDGACLTPIVARGTTDQHSQNQLYMEGPDDKVYGFVTCSQWPEDPVVIGSAGASPVNAGLKTGEGAGPTIPKELEYLRGRTFGELLEACRLGTRDALVELGRPAYEIILPELSERSIGAYMQMWMLATAYAGLLYNVNAFDQPGVERSKQLAMQRLLS